MSQRDQPQPSRAGQPGDDFSRITGIGLKRARLLRDAGILTFHDIARHTPDEIAEITGVSAEIIASQNWIGQARDLAEPQPELSRPGQDYAAFHIEVLLDSDNRVRRTKIYKYRTDFNDHWGGWDEERLLTFLRERIPVLETQQPADDDQLEPLPVPSPDQTPATVASDAGQAPETVASDIQQPPAAPPSESLLETFVIIEELAPLRDGQVNYFRHNDEPVTARLSLRIKPAASTLESGAECAVEISARKLGSRERLTVGTTRRAVRVNDRVSFELTGPPLPSGLYGLVATVSIYPTGQAPQAPPLYSRSTRGDLLQVADAPDHAVPASEATPLSSYARTPGI